MMDMKNDIIMTDMFGGSFDKAEGKTIIEKIIVELRTIYEQFLSYRC